MSSSLKEILTKANEAILKSDHEAFLSFCTEDTEWNFIGDRALRGKADVRAWLKETYTEPPKIVVDQFISEGDFLVAMGTVTVKQPDGSYKPSAYCDVWRFRGDKLHQLKAYVVEP